MHDERLRVERTKQLVTRPRGWTAMVLASTLVIALAATGCSAPTRGARTEGPIRYTDAGDAKQFPMTMQSSYSMAIATAPVAKPYTASLVVYDTRTAPIHLISAVPIAHSANLVVLGTLAGGPARTLGGVIGYHGYPPAYGARDRSAYLPLAQVPVEPEPIAHARGVDVLIGVVRWSGHEAWFDGVRVTYRIGGRTYVGDFPLSWAMCDRQPCTAPKTGAPWGR